jgi:hypothetical protein
MLRFITEIKKRRTIMIRKYISLAVVSLMLCGVNSQAAFARSSWTDDQVDKVKIEVRKRGTGPESKVVVQMKNGTKLKGYISQALDDSFDLTDAKTKQPTTIPYRDVAKVKRQGWSSGAKIGLGIAIGAAVVTAVVLGAVAKKGLSGFCPLGCNSMLRR